MNTFPDEVMNAVDDATRQFPDDIDEAVDCAVTNIRDLECFPDIQDMLVRNAIRGMVHDSRHKTNIAIKQDACEYGGPAKVKYAGNETVNRVAASCYDYSIGSKSLGSCGLDDLVKLKLQEENVAHGHQVNAMLCDRLIKLVPPGKTVREVVKENRLKAIFKDVGAVLPEPKAAKAKAAKPKHKAKPAKAGAAAVGRV